jgi:hypothetical protein
MKSRCLAALAVALLFAFAGCGSTRTTTVFRTPSAVTPTVQAASCNPAPGKGTMGACTPAETPGLRVAVPLKRNTVLIPDVSEFQSCALYSEAIFRVYEAGTGREDTRALCHARALQARHAWYAVYAFLRPGHGGCVYQANRTIAIVRHIGGVVGPIIADAEVWLPAGFVTCFVRTLQAQGYVALIYTAPGTWPGGAFAVRVWVAAYPYRPPCFSNACPYLAHQFSEAFNCRGVFGDCSVNEGILAIRQHAGPKPHNRSAEHRHLKALDIERHHIRQYLLNAGCRVKHPRPACRPLRKRGAAVNREIRVLKSRGVK